MTLTDIIGFCGFVTCSTFMIPQAIKVWQNRHRPEHFLGISISMYLINILNVIFWCWYAWRTKAYWSGIATVPNLPIALMIIWFTVRARGKESDNSGSTRPNA